MIIIALFAIAAVGIMVVIGANILEGQNGIRHPPDDDGCRRLDDHEQP